MWGWYFYALWHGAAMMTLPITESEVAHLPALRHRFDTHVWVPPGKSKSGYAQTERICTLCGAVKVTMHAMPDDKTGRAWRTSADAEQVETFDAPPCVPKVSA
jgi:hypothetical protein